MIGKMPHRLEKNYDLIPAIVDADSTEVAVAVKRGCSKKSIASKIGGWPSRMRSLEDRKSRCGRARNGNNVVKPEDIRYHLIVLDMSDGAAYKTTLAPMANSFGLEACILVRPPLRFTIFSKPSIWRTKSNEDPSPSYEVKLLVGALVKIKFSRVFMLATIPPRRTAFIGNTERKS
jgi:hypothetical protein